MARVCNKCGKRVNILDWVFHTCSVAVDETKKSGSPDIYKTLDFESATSATEEE